MTSVELSGHKKLQSPDSKAEQPLILPLARYTGIELGFET